MPLQNVCEKSYRSQGVSVVRGYRFSALPTIDTSDYPTKLVHVMTNPTC